MKRVLLILFICIINNTGLCITDNEKREMLKDFVNRLPQCKEQNSKPCQQIEAEIKYFFYGIDICNKVLAFVSHYNPELNDFIEDLNYEKYQFIKEYIEAQRSVNQHEHINMAAFSKYYVNNNKKS